MENYKDILVKYLQNECNHEELEKILQWLSNPANSKLLEEFLNEDYKESFEKNNEYPFDLTRQLKIIKESIQDKNITFSPKRNDILRPIFRIAASILLPIALGCFTFYFLNHTKKEENTSYNEITAPLGSKTIIKLGDNTKVWLNSGSTLRYPQKFTGKFREVQLSGEAFFDVKKDANHPFIVKTPELNIKVLGTSFNVKAYPEEGTIETTLIKGLVTITKSNSMTNKKETIYLNPNQRVTYVKEKGKLVLSDTEKEVIKNEPIVEENKKRKEKIIFSKDVDPEPFTAWKDERLIFKNEEFESLCIRLERWYGVNITIQNEALKKYHYTGTLRKETINDVIKILGYTMPIKYKIDHSVITIWLDDGNTLEK